ncbi:MAG TPA: pyridoxal-dependent decarboxylase [Bryobacteraceae bacterium]|jgi:glutamate/tyrosine decarboxylase-like PLP-dependent enzyme|nr:pyridoxal-dependent decarboxylase [Bryobacteraceae bacterium]
MGFRPSLEFALEQALQHLEHSDETPVSASVDLATLRARLTRPLTGAGLPPEQVVAELVQDSAGGHIGCAGGRFFGWVVGGSLPAALAADWLTSAWDENCTLFASGPAAAVMEEVAGEWLKEILGLPASASFGFVTGCQMAHTTCLAAARHGVLAAHGWDVEDRGLCGAPAIRVLSSDQRHGTIERSLRLLGLGRGCVVDLPVDDAGRLPSAVLREALRATPGAPTIVLLQAGDLNIGAYDSFEELIPLAHEHGAWAHVDGAFGLWAAASPRYRHLLRGVERADSWATDGHKWLNVPYDCGYAFAADRDAHRAAMSHRAPYLTHAAEGRDAIDWTPEWSRRGRGVATYAALRQLGRGGVAELIERCCGHARRMVREMGVLPGAELLWEPAINQGLVRFRDPRGLDDDAWTDRVIARVVHSGEAFFGGTTWRGKRAMRVSVCNWRTTDSDVDRAIAAVSGVLAARE